MDKGISSFDNIPQEQAAASEYQLVDTSHHEQMRATSFKSFTYPSFDTPTEITRPPYSRDNPVDGLSIHKIQDFTSALDALHPHHADIMASHLKKNPHDGYYISDICSTHFETPGILERYQESQESQESDQPLCFQSEIMAPHLQKNPHDGYSISDLCPTQGLDSTLERSQASNPSLYFQSEIMAPHLQKNPHDGYSISDLCPTQSLDSTQRSQESNSSLYSQPEIMAPYFENNPYDGYSVFDLCPRQASKY